MTPLKRCQILINDPGKLVKDNETLPEVVECQANIKLGPVESEIIHISKPVPHKRWNGNREMALKRRGC